MSVLKDKVMGLINQTEKDHSVKTHVTCAVKHRKYCVNIKSCSIDLFESCKQTIQDHFEKAELLYTYSERMSISDNKNGIICSATCCAFRSLNSVFKL